MYDIHMHLIPGVDDGARNLKTALEMIRIAQHEGIRGIIATPHSESFYQLQALPKFRQLQKAAADAGLTLPLYMGCEVYCHPDEMEYVIEMVSHGEWYTMNDTDFVLTEFSPDVKPAEATICLKTLLREGYLPIIAHAERYPALKPAFYSMFRKQGCRVQCNVYSFHEESDSTIKEIARTLAELELVDFLGTDAHRTTHRAPKVATGLDWLRTHCSEDYFRRITVENPQTLLRMA